MNKSVKSSWIRSPWYDTVFILFPPFLCLLMILFFPSFFNNESEWLWLLLIVFIDVGHVYSTIYRTYMDKQTILKNKFLFYLSPLLIYFTGVLLHSIHPLFFWRAMAYLAVFHFIRQQYGFMRLYSRNENSSSVSKIIDTITIYAATLYPIIYWHLQGKQQFNWFVDNDFLYINRPEIIPFFQMIYLFILLIYCVNEVYGLISQKVLNVQKNVLILGTVLSWYIGIVYLKGDLTFTLLNVVSHGIPYYALVWAYGNKQKQSSIGKPDWLLVFFKPRNIFIFFGFLFSLAYVEELLWDGFIWKEHDSIFPTSFLLPDLTVNKNIMSLIIPLLALPQLLHYFIDGFIWKIKKDKYGWSNVLLDSEQAKGDLNKQRTIHL
jgi:positive regulator of sigma E activity